MGLKQLAIIAIDGPAGSGKSTVARAVATCIGFTFLDTGAMYRAIAFGALQRKIAIGDLAGLKTFLAHLTMDIQTQNDSMLIFIDRENVTTAIRQPEMGRHASDYSTIPVVRDFCTRMQREIGARGKIVCEGRDMGTVVFPDARWKYFMTATLEERAYRRWKELTDRGDTVDIKMIKESLKSRDYQDSNRDIAPLKPAADAVILDTTDLSVEDIVGRIVRDVTADAGKKD